MPGLSYDTSPDLELVKTALDKLRDNALLTPASTGKATATHPSVFTQDSADKAAVISTVIGGGGYFKKTVTGVAQDITAKKMAVKNVPAPKTTYIAEFNKDISVSRSFMADQQHSAVSKTVRQETLSWAASRDQNAFAAYAFGFGTTRGSCIDAIAQFSNSHTNANGDTVDNLETGAVTDTVLNNMVVSMRSQKNQAGVIIGWEPSFLLGGSTVHHDLMIVAKSVLKSGGGSNDLNYYSELYPGMEVVWNAFVDNSGATNQTTMFFLGTSQHGIVRFEREPFFSTLVDWVYDENDQYKYKMRAREEVDNIEYIGTVGNQGV